MFKFYLLRHGQTELNLIGRVQGWNDSKLTNLGQFQAKCTGFGLKDIQFHKVYSGDSGRQIATAEAFLSQNTKKIPPIIADSNFREKCYGKFQGGPYKNMLSPLFERLGEEYSGYEGLEKHLSSLEIAEEVSKLDDSGESENLDQVWDRFSKGINKIIADNKDGNVLISTSSIAIAVVIKYLFPEFKQASLVDNASITVISYDNGKFNLDDYNNTKYKKIGEQHLQKDF